MADLCFAFYRIIIYCIVLTLPTKNQQIFEEFDLSKMGLLSKKTLVFPFELTSKIWPLTQGSKNALNFRTHDTGTSQQVLTIIAKLSSSWQVQDQSMGTEISFNISVTPTQTNLPRQVYLSLF